jgi:hypothetical protein
MRLILCKYFIPLFSFSFLTMALYHQSDKADDPITEYAYNYLNFLAPIGAFIVIYTKIQEPQTSLWIA